MTHRRSQENNHTGKRRWMRILVLLLIYGALLAGGHWGSEWLIGLVGVDLSPEAESHARRVVMAGIALYTVLMAIPFVPGMEISLALLAAFGHQVAVFIYAATVTALAISYLIGRLVSMRLIELLLEFIGQHRAKALVSSLETMSAQQRLETLIAHAPRRVMPTLLKHRYIAIAMALNLPGNAIVGGGGGIGVVAGISGLFTFPRYLAVVSLAALPVPLAVMLMGS